MLDRGRCLPWTEGGGAQTAAYFPREIGRISVGEPHGGLVMEKLGLCCADMSINSAPEGKHARCLAVRRTMAPG